MHRESFYLFFQKSWSLLNNYQLIRNILKLYSFSILKPFWFLINILTIFPGSGLWFPVDWATQNLPIIFFELYRIMVQNSDPYCRGLVTGRSTWHCIGWTNIIFQTHRDGNLETFLWSKIRVNYQGSYY